MKEWKISLRGSLYQMHWINWKSYEWMHDIIEVKQNWTFDIHIELLIDIAKGEQKLENERKGEN